MLRAFHQHLRQFTVLALLLLLSLIGLIAFNYSKSIQQIIIIVLCCSYFAWGVSHHILRKDLTGYIMLEYLLTSVLAAVLLQAVVQLR